MRMFSQKVAAFLLVALCLLAGQAAMAAGVTVSTISGTVFSSDSKPIPALVFVNGKSKSADKNTGAFTLGPLASLTVDQTLTLRVFAPGYAPVSKALVVPSPPPRQFSVAINTGRITMQRVAPGKALKVTKTFKAGTEKGSFEVSGTVKDGTTPVPALVCATGAVLACQTTDAVGKFIRRGKLSATGKVTLQVFPFSKAYQPYKFVTPDTDKDGTADFMDRDDDDDGLIDTLDNCRLVGPNVDGFGCPVVVDTDRDGKPDASDPCPHNPNLSCERVISGSNTVSIGVRTFAQPVIFRRVSYGEISAVCPAGHCMRDGVINGFDVAGWTWASSLDLQSPFPFFAPGTTQPLFRCDNLFALVRPIPYDGFVSPGDTYVLIRQVNTWVSDFPDRNYHHFVQSRFDGLVSCRANLRVEQFACLLGSCNSNAVWLYR